MNSISSNRHRNRAAWQSQQIRPHKLVARPGHLKTVRKLVPQVPARYIVASRGSEIILTGTVMASPVSRIIRIKRTVHYRPKSGIGLIVTLNLFQDPFLPADQWLVAPDGC
ncbi:hypothetical protein [Sphingobium yanoikuyae]